MTGIIDKANIIDVTLCEICHKSLPQGRRKYCSDECLAEGDRILSADRQRTKRETETFESNSIRTTPGMITMSVEEYTDRILKVAREERQQTEEEIYGKTIQVIDARFDRLKTEINEQFKQIQSIPPPPLQPPVPEAPIQVNPIEVPLLIDLEPKTSQKIKKLLGEQYKITGKDSYTPFNDHFGLTKHDQLKAKDGDRAEDWVNKQIRLAKQKQNHSMAEWTPTSHDRREDVKG